MIIRQKTTPAYTARPVLVLSQFDVHSSWRLRGRWFIDPPCLATDRYYGAHPFFPKLTFNVKNLTRFLIFLPNRVIHESLQTIRLKTCNFRRLGNVCDPRNRELYPETATRGSDYPTAIIYIFSRSEKLFIQVNSMAKNINYVWKVEDGVGRDKEKEETRMEKKEKCEDWSRYCRTRGFTLPDPYPRIGYGSRTYFVGRLGYR